MKCLSVQIYTGKDFGKFIFSTLKWQDRESSVGITTRYGLDCPGIEFWFEARFSAPVQTGPNSYAIGTGSFPGVKRPGRGIGNPLKSSAEVKERV
jgi:hypothetical protein